MNYDGWIEGYKVQIFPWIDDELIYVNVQYYQGGQSLERPPVWDRTIYLKDDDGGQWLLNNRLHSFINAIANMNIPPDARVVITAERPQADLCWEQKL